MVVHDTIEKYKRMLRRSSGITIKQENGETEPSTSATPRSRPMSKRDREREAWAEKGGYMAAKMLKLDDKFEEDKEKFSIPRKSDIFRGVTIHVNGYTEPTSEDLKQIMMENGGRFEHYYSLTRVTHIIATAMAFSKRRQLADRKVVHPNWIVESLKRGSLLPYEDYLLFAPKPSNRIQNMFTAVKSPNRMISPPERITSPDDLFSPDDDADNSCEFSGQELLSQARLLWCDQENRATDQEGRQRKSTNHEGQESRSSNHEGRESRLSSHEGRESRLSSHEGRESRLSSHEERESRLSSHEGRESRLSNHEGQESRSSNHEGRESRSSNHEGRESRLSNHEGRESRSTNHDGRESRSTIHDARCAQDGTRLISPVSDLGDIWGDSQEFSKVAAQMPTSTPHPTRRQSRTCSRNDQSSETPTDTLQSSGDNTLEMIMKNLSPLSPEVKPPSPEKTAPVVSPPGEKRPTMLNADHPDFISEYYGNSRLHHISEWSLKLKDMVNKWRRESKGDFPGKDRLVKKYGARFTPSEDENKVYMHIDMDCFFVSVAIRNHPHLKGKPVVVAHSKGGSPGKALENPQAKDPKANPEYSMSAIACCSYEARAAGVRNGMLMGKAIQLCENITAVPYDFDGYSEVSMSLYKAITSYTLEVEAVSCDELFVDLTPLLSTVSISAEDFTSEIRNEIRCATGCNVSAGLGSNILLARLATRKGKPNGQYRVEDRSIAEFMCLQLVKDLPGVGRKTCRRLAELNVETCRELQALSVGQLQKEFGNKQGETIYNLTRGQDSRVLKLDLIRQSVSCDINYGIRFSKPSQADALMKNVSKEVSKRLEESGLSGRQVTLKVKVRHPDAPAESAKFMGHGICESFSKSTNIREANNGTNLIHHLCMDMYNSLHIKPGDLRGVGIQVTKLEPWKPPQQTIERMFNANRTLPTKQLNKASTPAGRIQGQQKVEEICTTANRVLLPSMVRNVLYSIEAKPFPSLCGSTSFEDVKSLIHRWFKFSKVPQLKDRSMFTAYLTNLVEHRELLLVTQIMKTLYYATERSKKSKWREFYTTLRSNVLETVNTVYSDATLELPQCSIYS